MTVKQMAVTGQQRGKTRRRIRRGNGDRMHQALRKLPMLRIPEVAAYFRRESPVRPRLARIGMFTSAAVAGRCAARCSRRGPALRAREGEVIPVTKAELQEAYDDLCGTLQEIGDVLEGGDSDEEKLAAIEGLVFEEEGDE